MRQDLDELIRSWPYEPDQCEQVAREARGYDGRKLLQVRIELGVLQLEMTGRPDGARPHGFNTYLEYLRYVTSGRAQPLRGKTVRWAMSAEQCAELDREFIQFYHRRVAWRSLGKHDRVIQDAEHTLALMDFVLRHGIDEEYIASHEQCRAIVLFHRAEAGFAMALERKRPEEAVDALREGIDRLNAHQRVWWEENDSEESPVPKLVERLAKIEREVRERFLVRKTLREQLDEAVVREDYEQAAKLRDLIQAQAQTQRSS
jgi:UvrB/uvrC motif